MKSHRPSVALFVCLVAALPASLLYGADCTNPFSKVTSFVVGDSPESRIGSFIVGFAFGGSTRSGAVVVYKNGQNWRNAPVSGTGTITFDNWLYCIHGTYEWKAVTMTGCPGGDDSLTIMKQYNSNPAVSITEMTMLPDGLLQLGVNYAFPYIGHGDAYNRLFNVNINGVPKKSQVLLPPGEPWTGHMTIGQVNPGCLPTGTYDVVVVAEACGAPFVPGPRQTASAPVPMEVLNPKITGFSVQPVDAAGRFEATVGYIFGVGPEGPEPSGFNNRRIVVYWNGVQVASAGAQQLSRAGTIVLPFSRGCMITPGAAQTAAVKAVAIACDKPNDPAYKDEREITLQLPAKKGNIDVTALFDPAIGRFKVHVAHTLPPGVSVARRVVRVSKIVGSNGAEQAGVYLDSGSDVTATPGFADYEYTPPEGTREVTFEATLSACNWQARGVATESCAWSCAAGPPIASRRPVFYHDSNMNYADAEPLPPMLDSVALDRSYDTHRHVRGAFGRGWVSMFENRLLVNSDPAGDTITLTHQNRDSAVFFRTSGMYTQLWPKGTATLGTLALESMTGLYVYRPAASTTALLYRPSDGRFAGFRQIGTGREMRITWTAGNLPLSVNDSWSSLTWSITTDSATRRITAIDAGGLTWRYQYDANANLTSVLGPGGSTWRTYEYLNNRMTVARDAADHLIESHAYDAFGRATDSTGPDEEIQNIEYNAAGTTATQLVTRVTMRSGAIAQYTLRPIGGAWRTVRISGGCASCGVRDGVYAYDIGGHLTREQDASGHVTVRTWAGDRLVSTQQYLRPQACETLPCMLEPDTLGGAGLISTAATITTSYEYGDALWPDRVTAVITPSITAAGQTRREESVYHPVTGEVVTRTIRSWSTVTPPVAVTRATQTTLYAAPDLAPAFEPGGNFQAAWLALAQPSLLRKSIDGPRTDVQDVTSFVYYPVHDSVPSRLRGKLAATKNAAGHISRFEDYDLFGNVTRVVDPNGVATETATNDLGRPTTSTIRGIAGCDTNTDAHCATNLTTTRVWSPAFGPLQSEQRPLGGTTVYDYDSRGRIETISRGPSLTDLREQLETTWDPATGLKSRERVLAFDGGAWIEKKRETFAYDTLGQLQSITHPDATFIQYTYDHDGRLSGVRDENHASPNTTYEFDPAGRIAKVRQTPGAGLVTTQYEYDVHGNLTSVTDPNGNVTRYTWDDFGSMLTQVSPVTGTTTYEYDAAGNLTKTTDANAAITTRTYDALGRVLAAVSSKSGSTTETVSWTYDDVTSDGFGIGRLAAMSDPAGSTSYFYERRGLLRREQRTFAGDPSTTTFRYDRDGNRTSIEYPSGTAVQYTFDYGGRPMSAARGSTSLASSAQYLPFGPLKSLTYGNGTRQTMQYDARYRMIENKLTAGMTTLAEHDYTYDPVGNITAISDAGDANYNRAFGYDGLSRLTTAGRVTSPTGAALWGTASFTYDAMGNMLSSVIGNGATTVLAHEAHFTYAGTTPKVATVRRSSLNDPGQLSRIGTHAVNYETVTYDAAGNELSYVASRNYSPRNLLQSVREAADIVGSGVHRLDYSYDGRGVRVIRGETQAGGTLARRYYTYSPELQLLSITRDDGPNVWGMRIGTHALPATRHEFVWFAGRPLVQLSTDFTDGPRWYFADHPGTPLLQTNLAGTIVWHAEYEPYGDIWKLRVPVPASEEFSAPPPEQPLRFPGQDVAMKWEGTEERYNIFRWYRAGWGRYTQADPLFQGNRRENEYGYALANPLRFTDRLGLSATLFCRPVYGAGESSVGKTVIDLYEPLHCRIRVKCKCPEPFDQTVGRELVNGQYPVTVEPFSFASFSSPWFGTPIQTSGDCQFEKCVLSNGKAQKENPGLLPGYNALFGPNSNTWWKETVAKCGGQITPPPKTWSGF